MKLLLTSDGIRNDSIAHALQELTGKEPQDTKIAFIPTAAHADRENKSWLINDLHRLQVRHYYVDIIELTALTTEQLKSALQDMDVIFVGGGDTYYLSYWMQKSGFFDMLPELLQTKIYAGISAGSIIAGASLELDSNSMGNPDAFKNKDYDKLGPVGQSNGSTLKLADLIVRPHLNSPLVNFARADILAEKAKAVEYPVYAFDDDSALKIVDGQIEVVSEGEWHKFNG